MQHIPYIKHRVSPLQRPNWLMMFTEIITVCGQNRTKHVTILCGKNPEIVNVQACSNS
jgi:hypothetical protein